MSDKDLQTARKLRRSPSQIAKDRFDYLEAYALSMSTNRLQQAILHSKAEVTACAEEIERLNGAFDIIRQYLFPAAAKPRQQIQQKHIEEEPQGGTK